MQWGSRFCHPTDRKSDTGSRVSKGIRTEHHDSVQSLVRGTAGETEAKTWTVFCVLKAQLSVWQFPSHPTSQTLFSNFEWFMKWSIMFLDFQVGGWTQVYGNVLSFATIRGASHEAPFSQPKRSLVLFQAFLHGQPLPEAFWSKPNPIFNIR